MGTRIFVELWEPNESTANRLMDDVVAEMERINQLMSPYINTSMLSELNQNAADGPVKVSVELYNLIRKANHFSQLSNGAFDITIGSLGHRFDYRKGVKPSEKEREMAAKVIDYRALVMTDSDHSIAFSHPGMRVDLGGIAKGYAVDNAIEKLKQAGIAHAIVTAGGDSRIIGDHRGRPWILGIRNPRGEGHVISVPLAQIAISTSGDYERYFEQDGVRYHHIIDPQKGTSARRLLSATILADRSVDADALSTTVFVLGAEKGLALINSMPNVSAIVIDPKGKVHYSQDLIDPSRQ